MAEKKKVRKVYAEEFRREAVRLVREGRRPVAQAARELGVSQGARTSWLQRDASGQLAGRTDTKTLAQEVERLRRQVRQLEEEKTILKEAAAFFAKEGR